MHVVVMVGVIVAQGLYAATAASSSTCVVYSKPNTTALEFPGDLGIQWDTQYDTQWWLGNFVDVANSDHKYGVELSVARVLVGSNCSHTEGLLFLFLGLSDAVSQTYTEAAWALHPSDSGVEVRSTAQPYNVSVVAPKLGAHAGVFSPDASNPLSQVIFANPASPFDAAYRMNLTTTPQLSNVHMAADGWLDMVVTLFAQIAQPVLGGVAQLTLPSGERVVAKGDAWLQHIWGTDPLAGAASMRPMARGIPKGFPGLMPQGEAGDEADASGQLHWTWQCMRLGNLDLALSLTKFNITVPSGAPQYLNLVNTTTGESTEVQGTDFTVELSEYWVSPKSGHSYARRSVVSIPSRQLRLTWQTLVPDNEHYIPGLITYYEAASVVSGTVAGVTVEGAGYLEHRVA